MRKQTSYELPPVFLMTNTFEIGGSERQFVALAGALRREVFRVELGCLGRIGSLQNGLGDVAEFQTGGTLYGLRSLKSRRRLAQQLRAHRIAIAHAFDFYANLMLIPTARLAGVPVVIGSHRQLGDLLGPARFAAQSASFHLCDRVVCNSHAAAGRLLKQGLSQKKVVVIPNGLPREAFAETPPALPKPPGTLRVGMIARMNNPVKNYPGFLHAAARLAAKFPLLEFLLVGDGPLRPELEKMSRTLGLEGRARFLGDRHDIPATLASMDVSVLPSFSESLSNAILESMAAGLPVVATRTGGNCELVREGETGFLVPCNDEISLADALERLLTQPDLRREFGVRARVIARDHFSLDAVRDQYEQLYGVLLGAKGWRDAARPSSLSMHRDSNC